jgi:hypothetical protein
MRKKAARVLEAVRAVGWVLTLAVVLRREEALHG